MMLFVSDTSAKCIKSDIQAGDKHLVSLLIRKRLHRIDHGQHSHSEFCYNFASMPANVENRRGSIDESHRMHANVRGSFGNHLLHNT